MTTVSEAAAGRGRLRRAIDVVPRWVWYPLAAYLATRILYLIVAGVDAEFQHWTLQEEMSNWDGYWYLRTAQQWYPHTIPVGIHNYSTLGFLPLYPLTIWAVQQLPFLNLFGASLVVSMVCGLGAVLQMSRLATRWWDERASRRAILFYCMFPGTIVFSMAYAEGLQLLLVCTALLALEDRRWWVAGFCAGLATAVSPLALAIVPACVAASVREFHRHRDGRPLTDRGVLTDRRSLRSLAAPLLSPWGLVGFGIFLWAWAGTPFASYIAQNRAWEEASTPMAIPDVVSHLWGELFGNGSIGSAGPSGTDLNAVHSIIGAALFIWGMYLLWSYRRNVDLTAIVWTCGVFLLAFTSAKTPPNARILICAFPALLAIGVRCQGKWRWIVLALEFVALLVMSYYTYVGNWLRP